MIADGLVAVVKRACPTCELVAPVLAQLSSRVTIYSQDDPTFPDGLGVHDDRDLDVSFALDIDTVPTLLRVEHGRVVDRLEGWERQRWEAFTGIGTLGPGLPDWRPGCGSRTHDPDVVDARIVAAVVPKLRARTIELGDAEDVAEAMHARDGATDCHWCHPRRSASHACVPAPHAILPTWSPSYRPTSSSARSRRSRSTR